MRPNNDRANNDDRQSTIEYCAQMGVTLEKMLVRFFICIAFFRNEGNWDLIEPLLSEMAQMIIEQWQAVYQVAANYPDLFPDELNYLLI